MGNSLSSAAPAPALAGPPALAFARAGASVVVTGRGEDALQETARQVESEGARTLVITCDIDKAGEVRAALEQVAEVFGRLDYAFNNAGVAQPQIRLPMP